MHFSIFFDSVRIILQFTVLLDHPVTVTIIASWLPYLTDSCDLDLSHDKYQWEIWKTTAGKSVSHCFKVVDCWWITCAAQCCSRRWQEGNDFLGRRFDLIFWSRGAERSLWKTHLEMLRWKCPSNNPRWGVRPLRYRPEICILGGYLFLKKQNCSVVGKRVVP